MNLEFQLELARLSDLIRIGVERELMVRDVGFTGLQPDIPFFASVADLIDGKVETATAAIDHVRLTGVSLQRGRVRAAATINVPPILLIGLPGPAPLPRTVDISVAQPEARVTIEVHFVKESAMRAANGNAVDPAEMMVVQLRANFVIPPLAVSGATLAISPAVVDIELGAEGSFIRLPPVDERMGIGLAAEHALFREQNPLLFALDDTWLAQLYALMLRLNDPVVLDSLAIPAIRFHLAGIDTALASLPGPAGALRIWNAGLMVGGTRAVVRLQAEPGGLRESFLPGGTAARWAGAWTAFYASEPGGRLGAQDWSLFIPDRMFVDSLHASIIGGVGANPGIAMSAGGEPRSEWQIVGGTPDSGGSCSGGAQVRVVTRFAIFVPGACMPWGLGVDVNVQLTILLSITAAGALRADLHVDFGPDEGDIAGCALLNSLTASAVGFVIGGTFGGFIGAAVVAGVLGLAGGLATIIAGYTYDPGALSLGAALQPVPGSERDFFMEVPLAADLTLNGTRFEIVEMAACPDGFCVRGRFVHLEMELLLAGRLRIASPFAWTGMGSCTGAPQIAAAAFLQWDIERTRPGDIDMPLVRFMVRFLAANPALPWWFMPFLELEHSSGMVLSARIDASLAIRLTEAVVRSGIPDPWVEIFIQTNVGARIVRFNALDGSLTQATLEHYGDTRYRFCALMEMGRRARRLPTPFRALLDRGSVSRKLTIRPRKGARVMSVWTLLANGLADGDAMRIGRIASTGASETGFIHEFKAAGGGVIARVVEYAHKDDSRLALQLATQTKEGMLAMSWLFCHETARIPFAGALRDFAMDRVDGDVYLAVLADGGLDVHVLAAAHPRHVLSTPSHGKRQLRWENGMLIIDGSAPAHYQPAWQALAPGLPDAAACGRQRAQHRQAAFDESGRPLSFAEVGRLAVVAQEGVQSLSVYERVDRKDPDPLPSGPAADTPPP